jgi:hypothetical protein
MLIGVSRANLSNKECTTDYTTSLWLVGVKFNPTSQLQDEQFCEFQLRNHLLIALLICSATVSNSFLSGFIP